jgi:hypothetical protein
LLALLLPTAATNARELRSPEQITVEGVPLRRTAQAHRTHLLGSLDLYTISLYSDGQIESQRLASADVAKALRIDVTCTDEARMRVGFDWRRELVPRLEPRAVAHLLGSFAPLRHGDVVQIEFAPEKGTIVRVNKAVAVSGGHHDLMLAFLDHWLGERPVSEEIKRRLLTSITP